MTRQKWTTKEQEAWLELRRAAFIEANRTRTAAKEFFPDVAKAFREKWPLPPPTQAEILDAGSAEFAERVLRDKADKRLKAWFHNNCRNLAKKGSTRDILNVRRPAQPRRLQPWQAYQALTYESMWKADVDKEWSDYKTSWQAEHPDEKPPKTRLEIMSTFMRNKFDEADDEMKARCEEYRMAETRTEVVSAPVTEQDTINLGYQTAIEKLPRSLLNIAESLWEQTGWQVTIMMGGPMPAQNGTVVTYITNVGKTRDGRSYKEFSGPQDWDEHMHRPFDRFLRESFTPDVCAARALPVPQDSQSDDQKEEEVDNEEPTTSTDQAATAQPSEYELNRSRNIKELKGILDKLKEDFPVPKDLEAKEKKEKSPLTKKTKGSEEGQKEETRQSARLKVVEGKAPLPSSEPPVTSHLDDISIASEGPKSDVETGATNTDSTNTHIDRNTDSQPTEPSKDPLPSSESTIPAHSNNGPISEETLIPDATKNSSNTKTDASQTIIAGDSQPTEPLNPRACASVPASPQKAITTILSAIGENPFDGEHPGLTTVIHPRLDAAPDFPSSTASTAIEGTTDCPPSPIPQRESTSNKTHALSSDDKTDPAISDLTPASGPSDHDKQDTGVDSARQDSLDKGDVEMTDLTSDSSSQDGAPVPSWLQSMLPTIRMSSGDRVWQRLVNEFVAFENSEPPKGNLPTKNRPKEITAWIRSKKKDEVPSIRSDEYGRRFIVWWVQLQPAWRQLDGKASLPLLREVPPNENWQIIKKGGTAGLYVAVVALSWWVKTQPTNNNLDVWIVVDDLLWVFQQLNGGHVHKGKRTREGDDKENDRPAKSRRLA